MKIKLTKKFGEALNGVDLSGAKPGDLLDIPPREAAMLIASEWALPAGPEGWDANEPAEASDFASDTQEGVS